MICQCPYCNLKYEYEKSCAEDDDYKRTCDKCDRIIMTYSELHPVLSKKLKIHHMLLLHRDWLVYRGIKEISCEN